MFAPSHIIVREDVWVCLVERKAPNGGQGRPAASCMMDERMNDGGMIRCAASITFTHPSTPDTYDVRWQYIQIPWTREVRKAAQRYTKQRHGRKRSRMHCTAKKVKKH